MKWWPGPFQYKNLIGRTAENLNYVAQSEVNLPSTRDIPGLPKTVFNDCPPCIPHALTVRMICRFAKACPVKCRSIKTHALALPGTLVWLVTRRHKVTERVPNKNQIEFVKMTRSNLTPPTPIVIYLFLLEVKVFYICESRKREIRIFGGSPW